MDLSPSKEIPLWRNEAIMYEKRKFYRFDGIATKVVVSKDVQLSGLGRQRMFRHDVQAL